MLGSNLCIKHVAEMFRFKKFKNVCIVAVVILILFASGLPIRLFERKFGEDLHYPYDGDLAELIRQLRNNETPSVPPVNVFRFGFSKTCGDKCENAAPLRLVLLLKSSPENRHRRDAIRQSWGNEGRFSDVDVRRVFLVGRRNSEALEHEIDEEFQEHNDIVQANFVDHYYNNTLKTMMGFVWATKHCANAKFYMFVDDDYYVSMPNLLSFLRNPAFETSRLYAGHVRHTSPLRQWYSKWYISLEDYPYDRYPPFVNGGAFVLSKEALMDMYHASIYTKYFIFDDIYVALLAFRSKIKPFHCEKFYFDKLPYDIKIYGDVIASHGYGDTKEMLAAWTQQKNLGNA